MQDKEIQNEQPQQDHVVPDCQVHATEPADGQIQKELNETKDQLLRALAEMDNIRKRAQKEREDAQKFGLARFARDLLSVSDNLRRAVASVPQSDQMSGDMLAFIQGVTMIEQELSSAFQKAHITPVLALHQKFDAAWHQAVVELESTEHAPGTVIQVIQEGYQLHDRLLRPALVGVAKAAQKTADSAS